MQKTDVTVTHQEGDVNQQTMPLNAQPTVFTHAVLKTGCSKARMGKCERTTQRVSTQKMNCAWRMRTNSSFFVSLKLLVQQSPFEITLDLECIKFQCQSFHLCAPNALLRLFHCSSCFLSSSHLVRVFSYVEAFFALAAFLLRTGSISTKGSLVTVARCRLPSNSTCTWLPEDASSGGKKPKQMLFSRV